MESTVSSRAVAAATSIATSFGLPVDDTDVLHNSNKLTVRLLPCDVVARVAPEHEQNAAFELEIAQQLAGFGSPVAALEPRVEPRFYSSDGFVITYWTHYRAVESDQIRPADYADALYRLHAGMRQVDLDTPHFTDRVDKAKQLLANRDLTPELSDAGRGLLGGTLSQLGDRISARGADQLLHGEPHPGNLLASKDGPVFIDFETCCRGPVEFDLAPILFN